MIKMSDKGTPDMPYFLQRAVDCAYAEHKNHIKICVLLL
jgi:hypothetical protein